MEVVAIRGRVVADIGVLRRAAVRLSPAPRQLRTAHRLMRTLPPWNTPRRPQPVPQPRRQHRRLCTPYNTKRPHSIIRRIINTRMLPMHITPLRIFRIGLTGMFCTLPNFTNKIYNVDG